MGNYAPPYPNAATDPFNQVPGMNKSSKEAATMADVELLPLPEPVVVAEELEFGAIYAYERSHMEAYARANMETLRAEVERLERHSNRMLHAYHRANDRGKRHKARAERLRAEIKRLHEQSARWQSLYEAMQLANSVADRMAEREKRLGLSDSRAERLAEALQLAAGELASIGDAIGHDHPEARRLFTLRANLISARLAAPAQEDRNG